MQSLRERLREAEFQNSERSQDLISLKTKLSELLREKARGTEQSNSSKKSSNVFYKDNNVLQMPSIYNFMPHLLDSPSSLKPALHVSQEREKGKMFTENLIAFYCFCDKCTCCKLKRISSENCVQPAWMQSLFSLVSWWLITKHKEISFQIRRKYIITCSRLIVKMKNYYFFFNY